METLEQRVESLRARKTELESQDDIDINEYNRVLNRLSEAELELSQQQAKEERVQAQEEQKAAFALPQDYNSVFGDPRANDEITNIVQQTMDAKDAYYEQVIADMEAQYTQKIQLLTKQGMEAENQLAEQKRQNDHLQQENQAVNETCNQLRIHMNKLQIQLDEANCELSKVQQEHIQTKIELSDALSKRDAAVAEAEMHKTRADELAQRQSSTYKVTDKRGFQLNLTSSINDQPKTALEIALQRTGGITPPPLPVEEQPNGESFRAQNTETESGVSGVSDAEAVTFQEPVGVPDVQQEADAGDSIDHQPAVGTLDAEEIEARFQRIEEYLGLKSWRYDGDAA